MCRLKTMALRAWIGALLGFLFPAVAQNLLTNGDFETGTASGWTTALTQYAGTGSMPALNYKVSTSAANALTGTSPTSDHTPGSGQYMFSARGAAANSTTTIVAQQAVTVANGKFYTFVGFAADSAVVGGNNKWSYTLAYSDVPAGGSFTNKATFTSMATSWTAFLVNFTYTGSKTSLTLYLEITTGSTGSGQNNMVSFDDLDFKAPEPATWGAIGAVAGMVAWGGWQSRRRRRRKEADAPNKAPPSPPGS
jgi:hypothetical protein